VETFGAFNPVTLLLAEFSPRAPRYRGDWVLLHLSDSTDGC